MLNKYLIRGRNLKYIIKHNFRNHSFIRLIIFSLVFYICYYMGVFTHFLERDVIELQTELRLNQINSIGSLNNIDKNIDLKDQLNFHYIHNQVDFCKPAVVDNKHIEPYIVILVKSKFANFENRQAIRSTWAKPTDKNLLIRTIFLIGYPSDEDFKAHRSLNDLLIPSPIEQIKTESQTYRDIIQQDFIDTYYNNTLKTCMGIKWITQYCPNSKYYLFIDDDFFLNPKFLMSFLRNNLTNSMTDKLYAGYVFDNSSPMRHFISKWYISLKEYPYNKFPPYAAAGWYILSQNSVKLFYSGTKTVKLFRFDDIYLGIVAQKYQIKPLHLESVYFYTPDFDPKFFINSVMASHGFSQKNLIYIWKQIEDRVKFTSE